MSKFMRGGAPRIKIATPSVGTSLDIQGQGSVPYAKTVNVPVPSAPKGEQKVRGYGLQLRATTFVIR
tara:strand:+ start:190 stop:390 length:201 start_codon:yes stop_codon:yes gene_type:complete